MAGSDPQKVSNYSSLLIHWIDPQESQDNATRIDELQRQIELDRIEIEKELELGLENSHSLSDDPERKCELESGPNSEESRVIEPEQEVQTNPNAETVHTINVQEIESVHEDEDGRFEDMDVLLFADTLLKNLRKMKQRGKDQIK